MMSKILLTDNFKILYLLVSFIGITLGSCGCVSVLSEEQKQETKVIELNPLKRLSIKEVKISSRVQQGNLVLGIKVKGEVVMPCSVEKTTWTERTFKEYDLGDDIAEAFFSPVMLPVALIFSGYKALNDDSGDTKDERMLWYTIQPGRLGMIGREKHEKVNIKKTYHQVKESKKAKKQLSTFDVKVFSLGYSLLALNKECNGEIIIKEWQSKYADKGMNQIYILIENKKYIHNLLNHN